MATVPPRRANLTATFVPDASNPGQIYTVGERYQFSAHADAAGLEVRPDRGHPDLAYGVTPPMHGERADEPERCPLPHGL